MPKITILEQDLTRAQDSSVLDNVVYVPGYALMGPANEPTLCSSLSEFQSIFGYTPYKFKKKQTYSALGEYDGEYDKSYLYAAELLKAGLPVLFERVVNGDNIDYAAVNIPFTKEKLRLTNKTQNKVQGFSLGSLTGVSDEAESYTFTYDFDIDDILLPDSEKLTEIVFTRGDGETFEPTETTLEGKQLTFKFTEEHLQDVLISYDLSKAVLWDLLGEYKEEESKIAWTVKAIQAETGTQVLFPKTIVTYEDGIVSCETESLFRITGTPVKEVDESDSIYTNSYLVARAKYKGSYGENIKISFVSKTTDVNTNETFYKFRVVFNNNSKEVLEPITISFNKENTTYYYKNITSNLITFEDSKIDEQLVSFIANPIDLYDINFKDSLSLVYSADKEEDEFTVTDFYKALSGDVEKSTESIFEKLVDRDEYSIKFITSGSYPTIFDKSSEENSIATKMLEVASNRGDAIALVDHKDDVEATVFDTIKSVLSTRIVSNTGEDSKKYGAIFTPWAKYQLRTTNDVMQFPASFAYLRCLAASTKTSSDWNAVSGVIRGQVPDILTLNQKITGAIADDLQQTEGISINPITNIRPYGYCIWGNRTLMSNIGGLTASSFLNIRMLTSDVKKVVYQAAKRLTFELNNDVLWINFKSLIEPTLDQMVSGNGLSNYKIIKLETTKKATLACKIRLFAIEAVEDWDITVELADSYTTIE